MAFYVGSCSYNDKTLEASDFYPRKRMPIGEKLIHYSAHFNTTEISHTFFTLPDLSSVFHWMVDTPASFLFGVRCPAIFTFYTMRWENLPYWIQNDLPNRSYGSEITRADLTSEQRSAYFSAFIAAIRPLHVRKKLGYILLQFPAWWEYRPEHLTYLQRVRERVGPLPIAIEVRHRSWFSDTGRKELAKCLKKENIAYVIADSPLLPWRSTFTAEITAEWGSVFRFYGQNQEAWKRRAPMLQRQNYLYSDEQLERFGERCIELTSLSRVHIMFNNCYGDNAVRNAAQMQALIAQKQDTLGKL